MSDQPSKMKGLFKTLGEHFGFVEDGKVSASGMSRFLWQLFFVVALMVMALSFEPASVMVVGFWSKVILALVATFGITLGVKCLLGLGKWLIERCTASIDYSILKFFAHIALTLAVAGLVMLFPGMFVWLLSKLLPGLVTYSTWGTALMAGFQVLMADTILGGLTGVSLMLGKRKPIV